MLRNFSYIIKSLLFFLLGVVVKRRYDVVFYYPQHFNRGVNNENQFFKHLLQSCDCNSISYIVFEEPDFTVKNNRNDKAIPFDFLYLLILFLRKLYGSKISDELKDKKIGGFIAKLFFRQFSFKNFITLSQSMLSIFRGINSDAILFDLQHGIIHNNKENYLMNGKAESNLVCNDAHLLLSGASYKDILLENERLNYFQTHAFVIGANISSNNNRHQEFNSNILITLQFTHDHTAEQNDILFKQLCDFISSENTEVNFYLKHHPRFNNEIDLSNIFKQPNVLMAPNDINESFNLCSLHATTYSTSTFDAALLGIPTIFIKGSTDFNFFNFNSELNYPIAHSIDSFKDINIYKNSAEVVKSWARKYYSSFNSEKFISLLK
ncbi:MAG: hypothetical protein VYD71_01545 [Bacteroidota bacterium]|nr:hypothetical protein [Bacteroidota bacterium]